MLWKNMTNKKSWIFHGEELTESTDTLENPARGWYGIYTFPVQEQIDPEELRWSLREGESLALVLLDIYKYRSMPLDRTALENIRNILSFFMQHKKDVILRPVYDREGNGHACEPDSFAQVMEHLTQIGKILKSMKHSVFIFQGMLVGSWGEMHDSRYLSPEQMRQMKNCMQQYLGKERYLAVRTPAQWRILTDENDFCRKNYAQLTLFDDGILGSITHLGTFGTMTREGAGWSGAWMRKEELEFISQITADVPCGGEVTSGQEEDERLQETDFIINELKLLHLTYLDSTYDRTVLDRWKKVIWPGTGIWKESSLYQYIGSHMGYRLTVTEIEMKVLWNGKMEFTVEIKNTGFGRVFQEAELSLIIEKGNSRKKIPVAIDITDIYPETVSRGKAVTEPEEGRIYLVLRRKTDGRYIRFANKNSTDSLYVGCLYCGKPSKR